MKTPTNLIIVSGIVVVAALVFGGLRMWSLNRTALGGDRPELDGGIYSEAVTKGGLKYLVPPDEVYESGLNADSNPALNEPKYDNVITADESVADELNGIAIEVDGQAYFYPVQIMNWHPIVNDTLGDTPLAVTYSTLTGSAVVYQGYVNPAEATGEVRVFKDSGKVYNNALLMEDTRGLLWNQTSGQAIIGDEVGQKLEIYPSRFMTWAEWKDENPGGLVLSFDTGYERDYTRHPYAAYETSPAIYFPLNHLFPRIPPKQVVYRVDHGDQSVTFTAKFLPFQAEPNETLGEGDDVLPVVAFYDAPTNQIRVYDRRVGDQTLTFERTEDSGWKDQETGTEWSFEGVGLNGRHEGEQLTEIPVTRHYAFANFAMFPNTLVSANDIIPQVDASDEGTTLEIE